MRIMHRDLDGADQERVDKAVTRFLRKWETENVRGDSRLPIFAAKPVLLDLIANDDKTLNQLKLGRQVDWANFSVKIQHAVSELQSLPDFAKSQKAEKTFP